MTSLAKGEAQGAFGCASDMPSSYYVLYCWCWCNVFGMLLFCTVHPVLINKTDTDMPYCHFKQTLSSLFLTL